MSKLGVVIRTNSGELEVEGETVKELREGLKEVGFSVEHTEALLKNKQ